MVCLIDDEHRRHLSLASCNQKPSQIEQKFILALASSRQPEIRDNVLEELRGREPAVEKIGVGYVPAVLEQSKQATQEQRLSSADFSGQDYKALVPAHPIVERRQRFVVPFGRNEANGVRSKIERVARKFEVTFVHGRT